MKTLRVSLLTLVLAVLAGLVAAKPFVFTAIPDDDESRLRQRFDRVARYLSQQTGLEVKYIPVKSYSASVTAFKNDQVQMAWFGGLSGVQARLAVPGSQAIAQGEEDVAFVSYFIAHVSTGLQESKDFPMGIAGRTFTFGDKGSTSGRLFPEYFIRLHTKKSPEELFKRVGFSGDHSKTLALVESGAYEVGVLNFTVWELNLKEKKFDPTKVRVIWKTPPYPDYNFSVRGDVDRNYGAGTTAKLQQALLDMRDPALLAAFPRKRFIKATNADYQAVLEVGKLVGLLE
jgi:phosphonate transport system substrate-binding protein